MTEPTIPPATEADLHPPGISSSQTLVGLIAAGAVTVTGVAVIAIFGGTNSTTATNSLIVVMAPIMAGLLATFVVKLQSVHRQINSRMDELKVVIAKESYGEGLVVAMKSAMIEAARVALETQAASERREKETAATAAQTSVDVAAVEAERAATAQDEAEARTPPGAARE